MVKLNLSFSKENKLSIKVKLCNSVIIEFIVSCYLKCMVR